MSKAVQVVTTLTPANGKKDAVHSFICDLSNKVQGNEPGCIGVDVMYHEESGDFILVERFKDQAALDIHFKQPYIVEFKKSTAAAGDLEALDIKLCSVVEGTFNR